MDASDKTRIQYANKFAGSSNYWKNSIGMNKAIIDNDVLGAKAEQEKKFNEFAKNKPEYQGVVNKIDSIVSSTMPVTRQFYYLSEAFRGAIEFGSPFQLMDQMKRAINEKNDSLKNKTIEELKGVFAALHNKDYDHDGVEDTGCPLKVIHTVYAKRIPFFNGMHRFIPALILLQEGKIKQIPVHHFPRMAGQSKYHLWNRLISPFIDCFAYKWMKKRYINYQITKNNLILK